MAPKHIIAVRAVMLSYILSILYPAPVASHQFKSGCCTSYQKKLLPPRLITGYREQTPLENCRIPAIIFFMMNRTNGTDEVCSNPKQPWVRQILGQLSIELKKMSLARRAVKTKRGISSNRAGGTVQVRNWVSGRGTGPFYYTGSGYKGFDSFN